MTCCLRGVECRPHCDKNTLDTFLGFLLFSFFFFNEVELLESLPFICYASLDGRGRKLQLAGENERGR